MAKGQRDVPCHGAGLLGLLASGGGEEGEDENERDREERRAGETGRRRALGFGMGKGVRQCAGFYMLAPTGQGLANTQVPNGRRPHGSGHGCTAPLVRPSHSGTTCWGGGPSTALPIGPC
ncbi:hypothetical protein E2562_017419 [Oryza meyeriana var. granulata]|uniref:Uncharacterized protein n=1 Tax=Oryza meyeriana var. granulata TaxID=110450 RepID=A0A6G1D5R2_9ORYZ|nr:hypothetical protein E2562_017419 [Oryza meyeriana var. granulata]